MKVMIKNFLGKIVERQSCKSESFLVLVFDFGRHPVGALVCG